MKNFILPFAVILLGLSACKKNNNDSDSGGIPPEECAAAGSVSDGNIIQGKYIVALKSGAFGKSNASSEELSARGASILDRYKVPFRKLLTTFQGEPGGFVADLTPAEAEQLRNDASIQAVEPDRIIALNTCFTVAEPRLITWNINRVGYGDGIGKTAWIIDTGIDFDHPDLNVNTAKSKSFISGVTSADDENGHGTHVAGIIGGKNNSFGVLGVASGASVVSLRVLNAEGVGTLSSIIQALGYVNNNAKAGDVVNMSLGELDDSPTLISQVRATASRGIYIAIAAGNDADLANKYSPANANGQNIYTVSAIDSLDRFATFSNYGNDVVDYAAPGVRILSTYSNGRYAYLNGTSMAAPHVAGLLLLKGSGITTSGFAKNDPDNQPDPIAHF